MSVSLSLGPWAVFPHSPVGLIYVTQRFAVVTSAQRPDKVSHEVALKQGICRAVDERWRAADLMIDVTKERDLDDDRVQLMQVAVKVHLAKRQPETPSTEATAEDIMALFTGFETDPASASAALHVDFRSIHSPQIQLGRFGDAALQAAFDAVRITFVGPKGQQSIQAGDGGTAHPRPAPAT